MAGEWIPVDAPSFVVLASAVFVSLLLATALRPAWVIRRAHFVLAAILAISLAAASVLVRSDPPGLRLEIDPSTEPLLPAGDPGQELYRSAINDFGDDEVYVIAVECEEVFTTACLGVMEAISTPIARLPGVRSVKSLLDVTSFRYVAEEDWIEVRPFIEDIPTDVAELASLRARAIQDPMYRRTMVSDDSRTAALNITFRSMSDAELIAADLDGRIASIIAENSRPGVSFYVSGRPHFKTIVYHGVSRDLLLLIPLSVLVIAAVLWLVTGTKRAVVLPLGVSLTAILWTFSAMVLLGRPVTLLSGMLGPMLLAIGSVYGVHVLSRYEEDAAAIPDVRSAALSCLQHMIVPVSIAGMTTVVGFGALLITDVPAVFELGAFSMFGIASVTLLSLTGIPAALALLPLHARSEIGIDRVLDRMLSSLARGVRRRASSIIALAAVAGVLAAIAVPSVEIDTDYLSYFDESDPVRQDFEAINRLLSGAVPLYVVLEGSSSGAFREPDLLRVMEQIQRRLEELPGATRALSFLDSLKMLNRAFNSDDPAYEVIPDTRPAVTELLFMIPKTELKRFTTVNHGRANVIVRTGEVGSAAIIRLTEAIEDVLDRHPLPHGVQASVTGNAVLLAHSADGIASGQPRSVALASVTIFILITVGLRSPRLGAVAMIPNLLPVLIFFGILGAGVAPLSLPTSLIGCIALGIAIDDTVHFLVRYRGERNRGATPAEAALRCSRFVGRPIVITSVMLCLGFLVVAFSEFASIQEFAFLTAATMGICLLTDLVLLPAVLVRARI